MGWTLPSTGMWRGEVFAISDSLVWFVFNLMTGFGTQINGGLYYNELNMYTIIHLLVGVRCGGVVWDGVVIGVVQYSLSWKLRGWLFQVWSCYLQSKATNTTDLYRFLAEDCGYIPWQSIQIRILETKILQFLQMPPPPPCTFNVEWASSIKPHICNSHTISPDELGIH